MASGVLTVKAQRVRQNYLAILAAAIACFLFEAGWYTLFMQTWLNGIGRTMQWLESAAGYNPALQYGTAFVSAALTAFRGIKVGALLWLGFVLTTCSTEYVFEERPYSLLAVNAGYWLLGMMLMGAIVGGWKKKA